jgi:thioredoxin reductase (NADPH)
MTDPVALDCLIVGGGPAGLTAATYLGRFRRSVAVLDAGGSRLARIPLSRNIPGFPDGVTGPALLDRMREQAGKYGASLIDGEVRAINRTGDGFHIASTAGNWIAGIVLLATGVAVADPPLGDLPTAVERGLIRYCPICDGYEAIGSRVAVLGGRPHSIEEAHFLRTYADDITFIPMTGAPFPSAEEIATAKQAGITVEERCCASLWMSGSEIEISLSDGAARTFDVVYPCLGTEPRSELARSLGAKVSAEGELLTDKHQQTSTAGLFAAGDVLRGLDQVASACGQGAIAATAMHNLLRARVNP